MAMRSALGACPEPHEGQLQRNDFGIARKQTGITWCLNAA